MRSGRGHFFKPILSFCTSSREGTDIPTNDGYTQVSVFKNKADAEFISGQESVSEPVMNLLKECCCFQTGVITVLRCFICMLQKKLKKSEK